MHEVTAYYYKSSHAQSQKRRSQEDVNSATESQSLQPIRAPGRGWACGRLAVGRSRIALLVWYPEWWENKKIKWLNRNEAWLSGNAKAGISKPGKKGKKKVQCNQPGSQGEREVNAGNGGNERRK